MIFKLFLKQVLAMDKSDSFTNMNWIESTRQSKQFTSISLLNLLLSLLINASTLEFLANEVEIFKIQVLEQLLTTLLRCPSDTISFWLASLFVKERLARHTIMLSTMHSAYHPTECKCSPTRCVTYITIGVEHQVI